MEYNNKLEQLKNGTFLQEGKAQIGRKRVLNIEGVKYEYYCYYHFSNDFINYQSAFKLL